MSDIIQRIRDAYTENPAKAIKLLPELFKQYDEGRIPVLPCKQGDMVYLIDYCSGTDKDGNVCPYSCSSTQRKTVFTHSCLKYCNIVPVKFYITMLNQIGKTVFLTRESAEAALKKENESK